MWPWGHMKAAASKERVSELLSASVQDRRCLGPAGDAGGGGSVACGAEPTQNISLLLPGSPLPGSRDEGISTAEAQGEREGTRMALPVPKGLTVQGSPPQLHNFLGCTSTCPGGKSSLSEAAPLSLASSVSWGTELSPALSSWVPVSPHPAWLTTDAVKSWGCPLLITHRGAEAFIVGKALLAHSIPLGSPSARSPAALSPLLM